MSSWIDSPKLLDIACDVTIRFKGHRSYGNEKGALRALRRRAPGYAPEAYQSAFHFLCQVYDSAREAVPTHRVHRPEKATNIAEFEDIDYAACMNELDAIEPGVALREKQWILNWCIFWYHLK